MENARNEQLNYFEKYGTQQFDDKRGVALLHSPMISNELLMVQSGSSTNQSFYQPESKTNNSIAAFLNCDEQISPVLCSSFEFLNSIGIQSNDQKQNGFGSCLSTSSSSGGSVSSDQGTSGQLHSIGDSSNSSGQSVQVPPIHNRNYQEARYKTELCLHHRESNSCPHGDRCLFAHGLQELRPYRGRHPKHKTQSCKAFHETGYCNYGYRCSYIHLESPETIQYIRKLNELAQIDRRSQRQQTFNHNKFYKQQQRQFAGH